MDSQNQPSNDEEQTASQEEQNSTPADQSTDTNVSMVPGPDQAVAQAEYTPERFKSGHRRASIFTMVVLAAGCVTLGFLYYQTVKNLRSTRDNLAVVQQQKTDLESKLNTVSVPSDQQKAAAAGVTVKIPELGLQYQDTGQFSDLLWAVNTKDNTILFASRALLQKEFSVKDEDKATCGFGSRPIGSLEKVLKTAINNNMQWSQSYIDKSVKNGYAKDFGAYYLVYDGPQSVCDTDVQTGGSKMDDIAPAHAEIPDFLKALQPIK